MRQLFIHFILMLAVNNVNSQVPEKEQIHYSFVPIRTNRMDTNLRKISAYVDIGNFKSHNTTSTIYLNSKNHQYNTQADSVHQFNFGFIVPGKSGLLFISKENKAI